MAAENGNHISIGALGRMYLYGYGVPQDHTKALDWLRKGRESRELSSGNVEYNLSVMYRNGWGVPKDHKKAFELAYQAAKAGHAYAQNALGANYQQGTGVSQDYVLMQMWYIIAEQNGNELAVSNRKFNTRRITSSDLSKAKIMAKECMSSGYKKCGY